MVDAIPQLAWIANADGYLYWYNRQWYEYTGTTLEQMEGWGWQRVHDPDVLPAVLARWRASIATGRPFDMEFPLRGGDGEYRLFLTRVTPQKDASGRVVQWFGTNTDISERGQMEEALRDAEARYRKLADENERLYRQQLDIAENLQAAFLHIPSELGPVRLGHLYRSATEAARVGGDFYDVFQVKDNKIAVLMGDVAGHGIAAARAATLVKDVVHAFIHQSLRTHEVLGRTNRLLIEKNLPGYVTLFLGVLDTKTGELRYSSGGAPGNVSEESVSGGRAPWGRFFPAGHLCRCRVEAFCGRIAGR
jgi:PAS domain S-box-containing protein